MSARVPSRPPPVSRTRARSAEILARAEELVTDISTRGGRGFLAPTHVAGRRRVVGFHGQTSSTGTDRKLTIQIATARRLPAG